MITNKQKAKDLIKVAEKVMKLDLAIGELRETTRLLVKELKSIDEPIFKGEDDDIIAFSQKVDKWYNKTYKRIMDEIDKNFDYGVARDTTRLLKYLNQIKEDIDKLYKSKTTRFLIDGNKFRCSEKKG